MFVTIPAVASDGLSLGRIVADIPHDGAAFFIYAITAVSIWLIWQGSRTRSAGSSGAPAESTPGPASEPAGSTPVDAPDTAANGRYSRPRRTV